MDNDANEGVPGQPVQNEDNPTMEQLPVASPVVDNVEEEMELERLRGIFSQTVCARDVVAVGPDDQPRSDGRTEKRLESQRRTITLMQPRRYLLLLCLPAVVFGAITFSIWILLRTDATPKFFIPTPSPSLRGTTSAFPTMSPTSPAQTRTRAPAQAPTVSPSRAPTQAPTPLPLPITNRTELLSSVKDYLDLGKSSKAASVHGWPIGTWTLDGINNLRSAFEGASAFNEDINNWDVSDIVNTERMLYGAKQFNQNLSSWDVSSVETMSSMFYTTWSFNQSLAAWNVSNVKHMRFMFFRASVFDQDLSTWDVSKVQDMRAMLNHASSFNQDIATCVGFYQFPFKFEFGPTKNSQSGTLTSSSFFAVLAICPSFVSVS